MKKKKKERETAFQETRISVSLSKIVLEGYPNSKGIQEKYLQKNTPPP